MTSASGRGLSDWTGDRSMYLLVWGLPIAAIIAGGLLDVALRTPLWSAALAWMGIACLLNARRCGRIHCRYTGPFYLAMLLPLIALGSGAVSFTAYDWWLLGFVILVGGKLIWWATERAWGRYA